MTASGKLDISEQTQDVCARLGYPDRIFFNGKILTVDPKFRIAEAVAIREGRFLAVGSGLAIRSLAGPKTELVDLKGKATLPGLIDTHAHVEMAAPLSHTVKLDDVSGIEDAIGRIRATAEQTPRGRRIRSRLVTGTPARAPGFSSRAIAASMASACPKTSSGR